MIDIENVLTIYGVLQIIAFVSLSSVFVTGIFKMMVICHLPRQSRFWIIDHGLYGEIVMRRGLNEI